MSDEDIKVSFDWARLIDTMDGDSRMTIILELDRLARELGRISTFIAIMQEVLREEVPDEQLTFETD